MSQGHIPLEGLHANRYKTECLATEELECQIIPLIQSTLTF